MATDNTRSGPLCSRLLRTLCALVMSVPADRRRSHANAGLTTTAPTLDILNRKSIGPSRGTPRNIVLILRLLRAVIKTESDFRQHAVSRKGAVGLMQLTPATAATLRVSDVYDLHPEYPRRCQAAAASAEPLPRRSSLGLGGL